MKNKYFFSFILIVLSTILINTAKTEICTDQNIRSGVEKLKKLENCTVIEGSLVIALFHNCKIILIVTFFLKKSILI